MTSNNNNKRMQICRVFSLVKAEASKRLWLTWIAMEKHFRCYENGNKINANRETIMICTGEQPVPSLLFSRQPEVLKTFQPQNTEDCQISQNLENSREESKWLENGSVFGLKTDSKYWKIISGSRAKRIFSLVIFSCFYSGNCLFLYVLNILSISFLSLDL